MCDLLWRSVIAQLMVIKQFIYIMCTKPHPSLDVWAQNIYSLQGGPTNTEGTGPE